MAFDYRPIAAALSSDHRAARLDRRGRFTAPRSTR
jgi:hypothetical protein